MSDEDPDFIEFHFDSSDDAVRAEKAFPVNVVNLGLSLALRTREIEVMGEDIRAKLSKMGLAYREEPSSITEDDMWPDWGDDDDEETMSP